jgi:hypothetical protein
MESHISSDLSPIAFGPAIASPASSEGASPFQCRICGQVFTNQADLVEHMVVIHKQESGSTVTPQKTDADPLAGVG